MYYHNQNNNLFRQNDLSLYLKECSTRLEKEIKGLNLEKINSMGEQNLIKELLEKYTIHTPVLKENETSIDAHEAEIEVYNPRVFGDEEHYKINGLRIVVRVPFEGKPDLLHCRASTFSVSGTPEADIDGQTIFLLYETIEKDPERIKNLWGKDIRDIKQNLEWICKDLTNFNNTLENNIKTLVFKRKKEAEESQSLIEKIKG